MQKICKNSNTTKKIVAQEDGVKTGFYRFGEKVIRSGSIFVMVWKFEPLIIDKKVRTETFEPQKMPLRWQKFDFWRFGSNQNTINWQFKIFSHQNYWIQTEIKEYQNPIFLCFWLLLQSKQYLPEELLQDSLWPFRTICSSKTN